MGRVTRNKYSTWVGSLDLYSMSVALSQILHVGTDARKKYSMSVASIDLYTLTDCGYIPYILRVGSLT